MMANLRKTTKTIVSIYLQIWMNTGILMVQGAVGNNENVYNPSGSIRKDYSAQKFSNFDSTEIYQNLNFAANWTKHKLFWKSKDFDFEGRYLQEQTCFSHSPCQLPKIQVFVVPFSHNDPGWLKTYEGYFDQKTRFILDNAVEKLTQHSNMTFVWSEISFLAKWWDLATAEQKKVFKNLLNEGRLEILTGGWVMPDEACPSIFGLLNQLTEGHTWLRRNLRYKPTSAWSIDPFGHGSVMPYLLKSAGLEGMMIQRLHYAWKHWFAQHKTGDFSWNQRWDKTGKHNIQCLNAHYDLYPTKHSCGPTPEVCMKFNFRHIPGKENEENLRYMTPVTNENILQLADELMGQYRRTASLTRHNVVVTGLGNDFEFNEAIEWDQQYENYSKLFQFINNNPQRYNAVVQFGTLTQYFKTLQDSNVQLPNFEGDFFPYSDVYFPYPPAYWTGYYGTRPFWKKLSREAEDELRKAEILFTYAINHFRQSNYSAEVQALGQSFNNLVQARRHVALFQHHDGVTGTSPRPTMVDYAEKLFESMRFSENIQGTTVRLLIQKQLDPHQTHRNGIEESFSNLADQVPLKLTNDNIIKKVVLFNSIGWKKSHLVRILVETPNIIVHSSTGEQIVAQINPKIGVTDNGEVGIFAGYYELLFIADLAPLGLTTFEIRKVKESRIRSHVKARQQDTAIRASIQCNNCGYKVNTVDRPHIILENDLIEAYFDSEDGLLQQINRKADQLSAVVNLSYGKYETGFGSGAYLSRPRTDNPTNLISSCRNSSRSQLYVVSGPVLKEVIKLCDEMMISTYLLQEGYPEALSAVYITNSVRPKQSNFGEYFMSFDTDFETRTRNRNGLAEPTFYTDTGIGVEKRMKVSRLPYEGNMYPVTNFAYMQDVDSGRRLSILVDRSHAFTTTRSGQLETIFDRRLPYDDARGMDEGVNDPEDMISNYVVLFEPISRHAGNDHLSLPTMQLQRASKFLNHQPSGFVYDVEETQMQTNPRVSVFTKEFPPNVFLLNMRTAPGTSRVVPSRRALMTIQNLGYGKGNMVGSGALQVLDADLHLNHFAIATDIVGDNEPDNFNEQYLMRTAYIPTGNSFELSTVAVHF